MPDGDDSLEGLGMSIPIEFRNEPSGDYEELAVGDDPSREEPNDLRSSSWTHWIDKDSQALAISFFAHLAVVVGLAMIPILKVPEQIAMLIQASPTVEEPAPEFEVTQIAYSEAPSEEIGANSLAGESVALSAAPVIADVSEIPSMQLTNLTERPTFDVSVSIKQAVGLTEAPKAVRGMTGVGATGTDGAVDRITYEILQSIEERPTLVVWLFDASASLTRRRAEIRERFERIYEELGIVQAAKSNLARNSRAAKEEREAQPLLTSVISFGEKVELLTENPTADLEEITAAIDRIETDVSGVERVFSALYLAADKYKNYRNLKSSRGPQRNVLLITVTDERGDDIQGLEQTLELCRKHAMPIYVMGVPAPFGREFSYIKYVDPDPEYDQTPQWAQIDQGPESILPERIQLGYEDDYFEEPTIDSGFGPYALSRACVETGGIYFTVHPNRKFNERIQRSDTDAFASHLAYFFDPEVMERYRPDYLSEEKYLKAVQESPLRQALLEAARNSRVGTLDRPRTEFIKRDEAQFVNELTDSQREAARLEPKLQGLCDLLQEGLKHRDKELSPRWLASFDLSLGTALAEKVRAECYNGMLAKAKRGINFEDPKNNTWTLRPSSEVSINSALEKQAQQATELLTRVAEEHAGTPWGLLAKQQLARPAGWSWIESFTDLAPPPPPSNNPPPPPPPPPPGVDEEAMMLNKPKTRPIPKL